MADEVSNPVFARIYERAAVSMDQAGGTQHRQRLVRSLSGRVIEIGAGTGRNFAHYPPSVTEVLAVEPEPRMRAAAQRAARNAPVPVTVVAGVADRLPAGDETFDAAVYSLVLCSVPDPERALREAWRVLRPGGRLHFYEHVAADPAQTGLRRAQRIVDATVWPLLCGGCHTGRDTLGTMAAVGFRIEDLDRFRFPPARIPLPAAPHVIGTAVKDPTS